MRLVLLSLLAIAGCDTRDDTHDRLDKMTDVAPGLGCVSFTKIVGGRECVVLWCEDRHRDQAGLTTLWCTAPPAAAADGVCR